MTYCPISELTNKVIEAPVTSEAKKWEIKKLANTYVHVFNRRDMIAGPGGLYVDYSKAVDRVSTFRHYYSYDKKTGCEVLAIYKKKAYEIKSFYCALTEQACIILD